MDWIRVADMLAIMLMRDQLGNPIPFSITFITANIKEGTGGKRITYKEAVLVGNVSSKSTAKNPDHFNNYTRNIKGLGTDEIRKIHPLLVDTFNGKTVVL